MPSINDGTEVRGYVDFYNDDKGFGFVITEAGRVFFHQSAQRVVEGTPKAPVLIDRPGTQPVRGFSRSNKPSNLILRVGQGSKGPKAVVWGVIPECSTLQFLQEHRTLNQYEGGVVRVLRKGAEGVESALLGILLAPPQLRAGYPQQLCLSIDDRTRGRSAGRKDLSFTPECLSARQRSSKNYALKFYDGQDTVEIYFDLPLRRL